MIARIPAALLPHLTGCFVMIGEKGEQTVVNHASLICPFPAVLLWHHSPGGTPSGRWVAATADVGEFTVRPESIRVNTRHPIARDTIAHIIASHLGIPGDACPILGRGEGGGWLILRDRGDGVCDGAPLPIPADTPGAEVIGRAMAALWGAE